LLYSGNPGPNKRKAPVVASQKASQKANSPQLCKIEGIPRAPCSIPSGQKKKTLWILEMSEKKKKILKALCPIPYGKEDRPTAVNQGDIGAKSNNGFGSEVLWSINTSFSLSLFLQPKASTTGVS
jgi:hypothetical protein